MTFKRMRELQPYGVEFVAAAVTAAIKGEGKDPLLELSEDKANVRRVRPLEPNATAWSRSAYVVSAGYGWR